MATQGLLIIRVKLSNFQIRQGLISSRGSGGFNEGYAASQRPAIIRCKFVYHSLDLMVMSLMTFCPTLEAADSNALLCNVTNRHQDDTDQITYNSRFCVGFRLRLPFSELILLSCQTHRPSHYKTQDRSMHNDACS